MPNHTLTQLLALSLLTLCDCGHGDAHHAGACRFCACGGYVRTTRNDGVMGDVFPKAA